MLSSKLQRPVMARPMSRPAVLVPDGVRQMQRTTCQAQAPAATAWTAWDDYMATRGNALDANSSEKKHFNEIASAISKSAVGYKPKFTVPHAVGSAQLKLQHLDKIQVNGLPKDLHEKMEVIGIAALKSAIDLKGELDYGNVCWTTTDLDAALSVTGTVVQQGGERNAICAFVVCETERQASWSRLEGLILHWACGAAAGGAWAMPPDGWSASPNKKRDAGGAWQCQFEKQVMGNNEQMYVLVMQLPLKGILKSGGLVFVIKGTLNQADRWLKDAATEKDFYLDLQKLPVTKM